MLRIKKGVKIAGLWLRNSKVTFWVPINVAAFPPTGLGKGRLAVLLSMGESWGHAPFFLQDYESAGGNMQAWNKIL